MIKLGQSTVAMLLTATLCTAIGFALVRPSPFKCSAKASRVHLIQLPYDELRTRLVRGNFTSHLLEHAGCKLVDQIVMRRDVDVSDDPRPLINALLRRSKSTVRQTQLLTVEVPQDRLATDRLKLLQTVVITPQEFQIAVVLAEPAGILSNYRYAIHGQPTSESTTSVRFHLSAEIQKSLCSVAHRWAYAAVDTETTVALKRQSSAFLTTLQSSER